MPVKLPTRQENEAATTSLQISTPHVLNELARHEIKQSKVSQGTSFSVAIALMTSFSVLISLLHLKLAISLSVFLDPSLQFIYHHTTITHRCRSRLRN